jgi:cyclohexanone monooxygenase
MADYLTFLAPAPAIDSVEVKRLARHGCLDIHRVDWPFCALAEDGHRMLCLYVAHDAESIRLVLRQQGFSGASVFPVQAREGGPGSTRCLGDCVVVEWACGPADAGDVHAVAGRLEAALKRAGAPCEIFLHPDGTTGNCVVSGDDAERVTACVEGADVRVSRAWRATAIDPRPERLFGSTVAQPVAAPPRSSPAHRIPAATGPETMLDAVIIGAGMSGLCMLERLLSMGMSVRVYERGAEVGGVWHWNRYPGARVDSEIYTYSCTFSNGPLHDWAWPELFAAQPELAQYFRHVAEHYALRSHVHLNTRVTVAAWNEASGCWQVETDTGEQVTARFLIAASGSLTEPQLPDYPGINTFAGPIHHTACWPESGVNLAGQRVGVIGTGASGVQVIQTIADSVRSLTVFQRTPTYCVPQRNRPLTEEDRSRIVAEWEGILAACRRSSGGFIHVADRRSGLAVSEAEREEKFEALWQQPGFAFWFANFADLMMNEEVNAFACDFVRRKIRERVTDPAIAARLLPDHPFGSKRVPLENGYYEVFNRSNVGLVDLRETPIECFTRAGISTASADHELDVIVCATGFDAGTGALTRIDIRGAEGLALAEKWRDGPKTYLGLLVAGFPNFLVVNGPHNAAALCNAGRCIEQNVNWIARCLATMRERGSVRVEATPAAEKEWTAHVLDVAAGSVLSKMTDSWFYGANTPGKPRQVTIYAAGARIYREQCEAVAAAGYPGLFIS